MKLVYSGKALEYREPGHPESPDRVDAIIRFLRGKGMTEFIEPAPCTEEDLLLVHSPALIEQVKSGRFFDPDTPAIPGMQAYAALSVGGAIAAADLCLTEGRAFSLMRPPGHHAGRSSLGGFCYYNNIAVASVRLLRTGRRVAILDLDGHHGNGTEDILRGREGTVFISIHQSPAYPGTGTASFENCHNFGLSPETSRKRYPEAFEQAMQIVKDFSPDVLGVSIGFDGHAEDPLLELSLREVDYRRMGRSIAESGFPVFAVLEGGYNTRVLGNACYCFIVGLQTDPKRSRHGKST